MAKSYDIYCIVHRTTPFRELLCPLYLKGFMRDTYKVYHSYEAAEAGRLRGDAYDKPSEGKVVGFTITPFIPKNRKEKTNDQ